MKPCDLYPGKEFTWGYGNVPVGDFLIEEAQMAPRFEFDVYAHNTCRSSRKTAVANLKWDYEKLYNVSTIRESWGWHFFNLEGTGA